MAKATEKTEQKTAHKVLSPLKHDGKKYAVGDVVELTLEELKLLAGDGVVMAEAMLTEAKTDNPETK